MAELTPMERLQPCLLDRLTDENPDSQQESRNERVVSIARYRRAVLRDLSWLFNSKAHTPGEIIGESEVASHSVLNYGVRDMCGMDASSMAPQVLERQLLQAIRDFEPRILRNSLNVTVSSDASQYNRISFEIRGELWARPAVDRLYVKTELDLETGQCQISESPGG